MKQYLLQSGLLDRLRTLTITPDSIAFDNNDIKSRTPALIHKKDIADIKFDTTPIRFYHFYLGDRYSISIKDINNKVLSIRFKNYLGIRKHYRAIYVELADLLWEYFLKDIADRYEEEFFEQKKDLVLGKLKLTQDGIIVSGTGLRFTWQEVDFKSYRRFFVLSKRDKPEFHIWIDYNEWHSEILYNIISAILDQKNNIS
ncbi:hypothetical protein [Ohtaekwangia koreensis]|uniref:Uncharacterized protein n=1 Tax=Ohtaekwangia koreensis TaxID=688867 RepID=A0A1T5LQG3_9BACT|nr:hypothetical protein [Ohtaekwangia koreensis]SKC78161.1 hypothetical protein SAMN05660236_3698 [Ohtaekwangia koreensis]